MLSGKNLKLRALEPSDIELLYTWENDFSVWHVSETITPFSKHVIEQFLSESHQDIYTTKQLRLIIQLHSGENIGSADLFDFDPQNHRVGVGILIAEFAHRRKGYASEAIDILVKYIFTVLRLHQAYCHIPADNTASIKLFEKHKFKVTGTKKDWINTASGYSDVLFLQLINKK